MKIQRLSHAGEHFFVMLLVELTLYVTPCAMEMPTLLAALLHDDAMQLSQDQYTEFAKTVNADAVAVADVDADETFLPPNIVDDGIEHNKMPKAFGENGDKDAIASVGIGLMPPSATARPPPSHFAAIELPEALRHIERSHSKAANFVEGKHPHSHFAVLPPPRHCSIEITTKVPGICQPNAAFGNAACVSGDYMDLFNLECA